jgi:Flp pilus assembly protein TadB
MDAKLAELIKRANFNIQPSCNADCQQKKREQDLFFEYQKALNNMREAPRVADQAEEKYYIYSGKSSEYERKKEDESKREATKMAGDLKSKFSQQYAILRDQTISLTDLIKYKSYLFELRKKTLDELDATKAEIERKLAVEEVGYRSGYYDQQDVNATNGWSKFLRRLYWILVIVFVLAVGYKGTYNTLTPYIYLAIILLYPYTIRWIVKITRATRMADVKLDYVNKEEEIVDSLKK